jgi:hypothetical protein
MQRPILTLLTIFIAIIGYSQERVKPGKLYHEGEEVSAPKIGVTATIPKNWNGLLPRGEEIFLLSPINSFAEIFVMISPAGSLEENKQQLSNGMDFGSSFVIKPANDIIQRTPEILAEDLTMGNNTTGVKGYAEAKCGAFNVCIVSILSSDPQNFEMNKKGVQQFMDGIQFREPSNENPYSNFDWDPFLRNKQLVTFAFDNKSSEETLVNLCEDGTFKANFKKSGLFKDQGLKGKKFGTWSVNGIGPTTKLVLTIDKIGSIETSLEIRDEKIFANGERFFVSTSVDCK